LLGLLIVGGASFWGISLLGIDIDDAVAGAQATAAPGGQPEATETPQTPNSGLALASLPPQTSVGLDPADVPPPVSSDLARPPIEARPDVKGTIVFARDGDIWAASGMELLRLTNSRSDSSPSWSHDGKHIYFVRADFKVTSDARLRGKYTLQVHDIMRMDADGSGKKRIYDSLIKDSRGLWFSHVLQPDISPDGKTLAVVSDGRDGEGPVTLHLLSSKGSGKLKATRARSIREYGHNDPEWSPDGRRIAFTMNNARGATGAPRVAIFTCKTKKNCTKGTQKILHPNYANPSWSPEGDWLAAEKTSGNGRNIVIISANRGVQRIALTTDGDSFAPVVSPDGDQIAYLHRDGVNIDLRVLTLDLSNGTITLVDDQPVTNDGAIDASSPPAWYIPEDQLTPRVDTVDVLESVLAVDAPLDDDTLGALTP
jgi:dipeptidyl aminopeptidase/acylaminoacyl peptidase